ncbi:MAG TPA: c-type cytochrome [Herpetosiphonaceae bacterium]
MVGFVIVCMLALLVFIVRSSTRSAGSTIDRADATNVQLVEQGRQLYTTRCAGCHASDLGGEQGWPQRRANGVMPAAPLDERGTTWQRDDQRIFATIKHGGQATAPAGTISYMPALSGGLTDAEIWSVISYIKSTWPESIQAQQPQPNE